MSLEDIVKQKEEIMDMIYNVGWIFLATPVFMQAIPFIVGMLIIGTEFEEIMRLAIEVYARGPASVMTSGFLTMIYMTYKMSGQKSFISFLRALAKLFLKRIS